MTAVDDAVETFALAMADDELLCGHRLSSWVARAPTIEEDNALSSIVQDELGHARLWYEVVADDEERLVELAFERPVDARRNTVVLEPDYDDFADTVVRNLLYNEAERLLLESVLGGDVAPLADRAEVVLDEEPYHREHATLWLERLSTTEEARSRLRRAVARDVPLARDYFAFDPELESALSDAGAVADSFGSLRETWADRVADHLSGADLDLSVAPGSLLRGAPDTNGRLGEHTGDLERLLREGLTTY